MLAQAWQARARGDFRTAAKLFTKVIKLNPAPGAYNALATTFVAAGEPEKALAPFLKAMEVAADKGTIAVSQGYDGANDWSQAVVGAYHCLEAGNFPRAAAPKPEWMSSPESVLRMATRLAAAVG